MKYYFLFLGLVTTMDFPKFDVNAFNRCKSKKLSASESTQKESISIEMPEEVCSDTQFLKNYRELDFKKQHFVEQNNVPKQFIKLVNKENQPYFVRKSSILWMLETNRKHVSTDRLQRFIDSPTSKTKDTELLYAGDYAAFLIGDQLLVGLVLGFRYQTGRNKNYALDYCPLKPPQDLPKDRQKGIDVLCDFFYANSSFEINSINSSYYTDINTFQCHLEIVFDEGKLRISDSSILDFKNQF